MLKTHEKLEPKEDEGKDYSEGMYSKPRDSVKVRTLKKKKEISAEELEKKWLEEEAAKKLAEEEEKKR